MEKLVVTDSEVREVRVPVDSAPASPKIQGSIPIWARLLMFTTVLVLPLLCLLSVVIRIALRATAPRTREAWNAYLNTLLVTSALLTMATGVFLYSAFPVPPQSISAGIADLDERVNFPKLPSGLEMKGAELTATLKPLVMIATPVAHSWFNRGDQPSGYTGGALLLYADQDGYLFATALHVAEGSESRLKALGGRVLLTSGVGGWAAADVVGRHRVDDVALLWVRRHSGSAEFVQPISQTFDPGSTVYVIGHPEGLNFSISSGIVSRLAGDTVQISAPVSPGNSGGPVYDDHGGLLGVVSSKMDRTFAPNAENLSFAVNADVFRRLDSWEFKGEGKQRLEAYLQKLALLTPTEGAGNSKNGHN